MNNEILKGRGKLTDTPTGKGLGDFTPMKMLHSGGHANYRAMQQVVAFEIAKVVPNIDPYLAHVKTYIDRIDYMRKMFEAGRDKATVRQAIINMHTPFEELQRQAKEAAQGSSKL